MRGEGVQCPLCGRRVVTTETPCECGFRFPRGYGEPDRARCSEGDVHCNDGLVKPPAEPGYSYPCPADSHKQVIALLDLAGAAAELVAELDEDVKVWGVDHLPESTRAAKQAVSASLSRAANSQSVPRP